MSLNLNPFLFGPPRPRGCCGYREQRPTRYARVAIFRRPGSAKDPSGFLSRPFASLRQRWSKVATMMAASNSEEPQQVVCPNMESSSDLQPNTHQLAVPVNLVAPGALGFSKVSLV